MMSERIDDSSYAPLILIGDWPDLFGACSNGPIEGDIRIFDDHDYPNRTSAERLGTEVEILRRLVGEPELGSFHRQACHHRSTLVTDAEQFHGSKRRFVEFNRFHPVSN